MVTQEQLATEQRKLLGERSQESLRKAEEYKRRSREAKDLEKARDYEEQAFYYEQLNSYLIQATQYATGEFTTDSLMGWAESRAEGRITKMIEARLPPAPIVPITGLPTVTIPTATLRVETERYKGLGYLPQDAKILAEWSIKYQQTPSPAKAQQILAAAKLAPPSPIFQVPMLTLKSETERYKGLGYTKTEAQILAEASVKIGGITFIPTKAQEIIQQAKIEKLKAPRVEAELKVLGERAKVGLLGFGQVITAPVETISEAITGFKARAYVPAREELLEPEIAYYARPLYEKPLFAPITTEITPGVKRAEELFREEVYRPFAIEQIIKTRDDNFIENISPEMESELLKASNKIQSDIDGRKITYEEGLTKAEKLREDIQEKYQKIFEKEREKYIKEIIAEQEELSSQEQKRIKDAYIEETYKMAPTFVNAAIRRIAYFIPIYGQMLLGADILQITAKAPELKAFKEEYPEIYRRQLIAGALGGLAGGRIGGFIKGKYFVEPKIRAAIDRAEVKSVGKQITTDKQIKALKLAPNQQAEIKTILDKGNIVRRIDTRLTAKTIADKDILPDVRGTYIEVLRRDGTLIERISLGRVVSTIGKKSYSSNIISDATGKLDEGKMITFSRTFVSKAKAGFKPIQYYETLEQVKATQIREAKGFKYIEGTGEIRLLKEVAKPKEADITRILKIGKPTEAQVEQIFSEWYKIKPYGKAELVYAGKELKKLKEYRAVGFVPTKEQLILGRQLTVEYGKVAGSFERIFEKAKIPKPAKPWDFKKPVEFKPVKYVSQHAKAQEKGLIFPISETARIKLYGLAQVQKDLILRLARAGFYETITTEALKAQAPAIARGVAISSYFQSALTGVAAIPREMEITKIKQIEKAILKERQITSQRLLQVTSQRLLQVTPLISQIEKLKITPIYAKWQVAETQQQKMQLKQQQINLRKLVMPITPSPRITFPTAPPPYIPIFKIKETATDKRARLKREKEYKKQMKAYQASVAAVSLGIEMEPKEVKKIEKRLTGLEIRPVVKRKYYVKNLNKLFM